MDKESLAIVKEDLEYLSREWSSEITNPDIRRGSAVLRRLLVENVYTKAWKSLEFERQPKVIAVDLDSFFCESSKRTILFAMAWGSYFKGVCMATPCINKGALSVGFPSPPLRSDGYPGERVFTLSEFLESTSGIAGRVQVKRREVIKYVANIKGGVHLGQKTKRSELELIKKFAKFEKAMIVHTTDGILVEIVSIAQAIGESEDALKLCNAIGKIL